MPALAWPCPPDVRSCNILRSCSVVPSVLCPTDLDSWCLSRRWAGKMYEPTAVGLLPGREGSRDPAISLVQIAFHLAGLFYRSSTLLFPVLDAAPCPGTHRVVIGLLLSASHRDMLDKDIYFHSVAGHSWPKHPANSFHLATGHIEGRSPLREPKRRWGCLSSLQKGGSNLPSMTSVPNGSVQAILPGQDI